MIHIQEMEFCRRLSSNTPKQKTPRLNMPDTRSIDRNYNQRGAGPDRKSRSERSQRPTQRTRNKLLRIISVWSLVSLSLPLFLALAEQVVKKHLDILYPMVIIIGMTPEDLKRWRQSNVYSQQRLADALGVFQVTVARWETGVRKIPSFLALALRALELEGGERKPRETKTEKEVKDHGKHLPKR